MTIKQILVFVFFCFSVTAQARANDVKAVLDGRYIMNLTIGDHIFQDVFELEGLETPISASSFEGEIKGSITVPGQFSSDLKGNGRCSRTTSSCDFQFSIVAHEGGRDYAVIYKADLAATNYINFVGGKSKQIVLTGTAYLGDGTILGKFEAVR